MEWLASELPGASLPVFTKVGHFPFLEAPEAFVLAVPTFIRQVAL
jgi:pimeloyl-ACP methyl ester carboxylesterase